MGILSTLGQIGGIINPIAGIATSALGSIFETKATQRGQADANAANAQQAQKQMDFQERMSNTAHQREVDDLRAAGLNPAMAYGQHGESTPSGASATMMNTQAAAKGTTTSALQSAAAIASIQNTAAQTRQLQIESTARLQQILTQTAATSQGTAADITVKGEQAKMTAAQRDLLSNQFADIIAKLRADIQDTIASAAQKRSQTKLTDLEQFAPKRLLQEGTKYLLERSHPAASAKAMANIYNSTRQ